MSNNNRQMMKGRLFELQGKKRELQTKALTACRGITPLINPTLSEVEDMDIDGAASLMMDLVAYRAELLLVTNQVTQIETELYS